MIRCVKQYQSYTIQQLGPTGPTGEVGPTGPAGSGSGTVSSYLGKYINNETVDSSGFVKLEPATISSNFSFNDDTTLVVRVTGVYYVYFNIKFLYDLNDSRGSATLYVNNNPYKDSYVDLRNYNKAPVPLIKTQGYLANGILLSLIANDTLKLRVDMNNGRVRINTRFSIFKIN